jgi:hypothetical protein
MSYSYTDRASLEQKLAWNKVVQDLKRAGSMMTLPFANLAPDNDIFKYGVTELGKVYYLQFSRDEAKRIPTAVESRVAPTEGTPLTDDELLATAKDQIKKSVLAENEENKAKNEADRVFLSTGDAYDFQLFGKITFTVTGLGSKCTVSKILKATVDTDKGSTEFHWN